jgi:hypothetical protein
MHTHYLRQNSPFLEADYHIYLQTYTHFQHSNFVHYSIWGETIYCPEGYWNFATFCPCPIIIYISLWCRVVLCAARIRYRSTRENSTKIATQHACNHIAEASAISIRDRTEHLGRRTMCYFLGQHFGAAESACMHAFQYKISYYNNARTGSTSDP